MLSKVLNTLVNAAVAISSHPSRNSLSVYRTMRDFREMQALSDRQLRTVSRYIVDKKYIVLNGSRGGGATIRLTEAGKTIVERKALLDLKPKRQKEWNRLWRLVMFDIPTHLKVSRDKFAGLLKELGFIHYQKSVFIYPYPCEEELEILAEYHGISEYVDVIVAKHISRDKEYRKEFNLE